MAKKPNKSADESQNKKSKKKWFWIGGAAFIGLLALIMMMPYVGTINYGICKVFVEQNEPYPASLKFIKGEEQGSYVTIYYKRTDPFGEVSLNYINCGFKNHKDGTPYLDKVDINGKYRTYPAEDPDHIKLFNAGIPGIIANPPDLTLPYDPPEDIKKFKDIP